MKNNYLYLVFNETIDFGDTIDVDANNIAQSLILIKSMFCKASDFEFTLLDISPKDGNYSTCYFN